MVISGVPDLTRWPTSTVVLGDDAVDRRADDGALQVQLAPGRRRARAAATSGLSARPGAGDQGGGGICCWPLRRTVGAGLGLGGAGAGDGGLAAVLALAVVSSSPETAPVPARPCGGRVRPRARAQVGAGRWPAGLGGGHVGPAAVWPRSGAGRWRYWRTRRSAWSSCGLGLASARR